MAQFSDTWRLLLFKCSLVVFKCDTSSSLFLNFLTQIFSLLWLNACEPHCALFNFTKIHIFMFITFIILSLHSIFDFIFRTFLTHGATQTYPTILGKCLSTSLPLFRLHHSLSRLYTFIYTTRMVLSKHFFLPNSQFPFLSHSLVTNGAICSQFHFLSHSLVTDVAIFVPL